MTPLTVKAVSDGLVGKSNASSLLTISPCTMTRFVHAWKPSLTIDTVYVPGGMVNVACVASLTTPSTMICAPVGSDWATMSPVDLREFFLRSNRYPRP